MSRCTGETAVVCKDAVYDFLSNSLFEFYAGLALIGGKPSVDIAYVN